MPDTYSVRDGYAARPQPEYWHERDTLPALYQPDVYRDLARVAEALGCKSIIDVGCGNAEKLVSLNDRFGTIGIDFGPNIEHCRRRYDVGRWIEDDLSVMGKLPLSADDLSDAAVICSDVIEHIPDPATLVNRLIDALEQARVLFISTPERALVYGRLHHGPPANVAHVREWTVRELATYLRRAGLAHGTIGLSRPHDQTPAMQTILCAYVRRAEDLEVVENVLIDEPEPVLTMPAKRPLSQRVVSYANHLRIVTGQRMRG